MSRPGLDVVIPFRGSLAELEELRERVSLVQLQPGDSAVIVDNTPKRGPEDRADGGEAVVHAADVATPGYARNRGAERGGAEWIVFFDADTLPPPDLHDRYFDPPPGERTALLAGGVIDEPVPADARAAARYAYVRELMSQDNTQRFGQWSFPQMANAACRRVAFEAVGGFREDIRAAEDADLSYRIRSKGWEVERRENASVVHLNRATVRQFITQKLLHGAGAAWLARNYPGAFPARRRPGLVWWGVRTAAKGLVSAARSRDRDTALFALFEPLEHVTFEFGRSLPNERPLLHRHG